MATRKQLQKKLKGPDQFQVAAASWIDWLAKNVKTLGMVAVPLAALILGLFAWQSVQESQAADRREELGKIQVSFDQEITTAAKKREEIQKKIDGIEAKLAEAKKKDPAATPDAKLTAEKEALEKERDEIKPDHKGSLAQFESFYQKYDGKAEGWMAGMTAARIHLDQEELEPAKVILEKILENSTSVPFYQTHARFMLVGILEDLGEFDNALQHVEELEKRAGDELKPRVLLAKGRLLVLKKADEEAKATFKKLIEDHGASPEAQKARSIQALLN